MNLQELRIFYQANSLDVADVASNPFEQFSKWLQNAIDAAILEPNAMQLATVSTTGQPSIRTVLLKGLDERGLVFYTNYKSEKGQNLAANPLCSLHFCWLSLEQQVRIQGRAEKISRAESEAYFQSRPKDSQIGAMVSPQSHLITLDELKARQAHIAAQYTDAPTLPLPDNWGGYRVVPTRFEFWQGRPSRLHDRIVYILQTDGSWTIERIAP